MGVIFSYTILDYYLISRVFGRKKSEGWKKERKKEMSLEFSE
jgi:hypothetical protein